MLPLAIIDNVLVVASEALWDNDGIELLQFQTRLSVHVIMVDAIDLSQSLEKYYGEYSAQSGSYKKTTQDAAISDEKSTLEQLQEQAHRRPIVLLLDHIIRQVLIKRASHIHIQPAEDVIEVFNRVDGRMQLQRSYSKDLLAPW